MDWAAVRHALRAVRREKRVTLRALHEKTGISPSTVNRIERVSKYPAHKPDLDTLYALVEAMDVTLSEFFGRVEGITPVSLQQEPQTPRPAFASEVVEAIDRLITSRVSESTKSESTDEDTGPIWTLELPGPLTSAQQARIRELAESFASATTHGRSASTSRRRTPAVEPRHRQG